MLVPDKDSIPDWVYTNKFENIIDISEDSNNFLKQNCNISKAIVKLNHLFIPENGLSSSKVIRYKGKRQSKHIAYIRPSKYQESSVDAYVDRNKIDPKYIFAKGTLYVSSDGQGSHTYSYVSAFDFVPNSNVIVLIPKRDMSLQEKLFYSMIISKNRFKFSYGRKPKGKKLMDILVPAFPPKWFYGKNYFKEIISK